MNMNENHQTPPPAPKPLCAVYAPLLPLLRVDELAADQARAVREHLADCVWCQAKLATHAVVGDALRRHFGSGSVEAPPTFTLETIMHASQQDSVIPDTDTQTGPSAPPTAALPPRRPVGRLTALSAIAAVVLLAILVGTLFAWQRGPAKPTVPRPTAIPTLDTQTQAYVNLLHQYYGPVVAASGAVNYCADSVRNSPPAEKAGALGGCRPPVADNLEKARILLAQLEKATPPARWHSQHVALQQAVQGWIPLITAELRAIDARDVTGFFNELDPLITIWRQFCTPIAQLNAGIPTPIDRLAPPDNNTFGVCSPTS